MPHQDIQTQNELFNKIIFLAMSNICYLYRYKILGELVQIAVHAKCTSVIAAEEKYFRHVKMMKFVLFFAFSGIVLVHVGISLKIIWM